MYESKQEAHDKAKALTLKNSNFHTFIGQVGYWLPWDPNADKIQDEVFQNGELNNMMEKYMLFFLFQIVLLIKMNFYLY